MVKEGAQPARTITQIQALNIANSWKSGGADEDKRTVAFQSGLITGAQWDAMCNFIGWDICDTNCSSWGNYGNVKSSLYTGYHSPGASNNWINETGVTKGNGTALDSNGNGYYTNRWVFPTGKFVNENGGKTVKKNIYDVAGNVWEWTTEVPCYSPNNGVLRCGTPLNSGSYDLATSRDGYYSATSDAYWNIGFHIVLYVK